MKREVITRTDGARGNERLGVIERAFSLSKLRKKDEALTCQIGLFTMNASRDPLQSERDPLEKSASATPTEGNEEDQFDANEYVRQLIQRMGGTVTQPTATAQSAVAAAASQAPTTPRATKPSAPQPPVDSAKRLTRAEEMGVDPESIESSMRRTAPEKAVDLERLREAANITSHSDLHRSDCNGLIYKGYYHLLLTVVCMIISLVLVGLSKGAASPAYLSALALLGLSMVFAFRYVTTTRLLWSKLRLPSQEPQAEVA